MIPLEQALAEILALVPVLGSERVPIDQAVGLVLAERVCASHDIPPHDNSAMDGYAVRSGDTLNSTKEAPVRLRVIENLAAGRTTTTVLGSGEAIRIMTGAPLPQGADSVVPFEETDEATGQAVTGWVVVDAPARPNANVRRAGEDIARNDEVLTPGTKLTPAAIGVLAAMGRASALVRRRPIVAVLSTGDELREPGQPLEPGAIYDSNSYAVAAQVAEAGGIPVRLGIAADREDAIAGKIEEGLKADLLITSAGVSVGDFDIVKRVLAARGEIRFWTVRIKPGKPLAFGSIHASDGRTVPLLGLPGNPVSSMLTFELFGRPAIRKMLGLPQSDRPRIKATLVEHIENRDGRKVFIRAIVERSKNGYVARLTGPQGSGILSSMFRANGLVVIPEDILRAGPGDQVEVMLLNEASWI